jgi:hypothetical protein
MKECTKAAIRMRKPDHITCFLNAAGLRQAIAEMQQVLAEIEGEQAKEVGQDG